MYYAPVTSVRGEIVDDAMHALRVRIADDDYWIPRHLATIRDYDRGLMDVESWFVRQCLDETAAIRPAVAASLDALVDELTVAKGRTMISQADSRPHQRDAFEKLRRRKVFALLMKCRTGKTKVGIDLACNHVMNGNVGQVLWLCPVSVIPTARWQWSVFAQTLRLSEPGTLRIFGTETLSSCKQERFDELMAWACRAPTLLVIDESHMVKTCHAKRSKRAEQLAAACRVRGIMSGSPITRDIRDLYQQFRMLDWRILGYRNIHQFYRRHVEWSERIPGVVSRAVNTDYLAERIEPFSIEFFPPDNPDDEYHTHHVRMSEEQREWYERVKETIIARIERYESTPVDVYLLFTALQSVLAGELSLAILRRMGLADTSPRQLDIPKLSALARARAEIDAPAIVWCTRRHEIVRVAETLPDTCIVTGSQPPTERHGIIQRFRKSACGTLVAMVQVAKRGIDIFEADTAFFFGQSFDWESREQAAARIQAPGIKETPCQYIDLIYEDSLDERIQASHGRKENIVRQFIALMRDNKAKAIEEMRKL